MESPEYTYHYFVEAFENAKETAEDLVTGVDDEIFLRKPAENKWCMGEILSHLVQIGNEYLPQIKKGLNKPPEKLPKGNGPFTPNFLFRWFIYQVGPQNRRPMPTVNQFRPEKAHEIDKEKVLADFIALQDELLSIVQKAQQEELDLERIKTKNPIVKFVPMSVLAGGYRSSPAPAF